MKASVALFILCGTLAACIESDDPDDFTAEARLSDEVLVAPRPFLGSQGVALVGEPIRVYTRFYGVCAGEVLGYEYEYECLKQHYELQLECLGVPCEILSLGEVEEGSDQAESSIRPLAEGSLVVVGRFLNTDNGGLHIASNTLSVRQPQRIDIACFSGLPQVPCAESYNLRPLRLDFSLSAGDHSWTAPGPYLVSANTGGVLTQATWSTGATGQIDVEVRYHELTARTQVHVAAVRPRGLPTIDHEQTVEFESDAR